jgi:hypothetical protein
MADQGSTNLEEGNERKIDVVNFSPADENLSGIDYFSPENYMKYGHAV